MAKTSSTILNMSDESRYPCVVPHLSGKTFTYSFLQFIYLFVQSFVSYSLLHFFFVIGYLTITCHVSNIFKVALKIFFNVYINLKYLSTSWANQ